MISRKRAARTSAAASSTGPLKANTPPKAETGSQSSARSRPVTPAPRPKPQGLVCLITAQQGSSKSPTSFTAATRSTMLL